jgi:hypothetical protein
MFLIFSLGRLDVLMNVKHGIYFLQHEAPEAIEGSHGDSTTLHVAHILGELIQSAGVKTVAISDHEICNRLQIKEALQIALPDVQVFTEMIDSESSFERRSDSSAFRVTFAIVMRRSQAL